MKIATFKSKQDYNSYKDTYTKDTYTKDTYTKDTYTKDTYTKDTYTKDTYTKDTYTKDTHMFDNHMGIFLIELNNHTEYNMVLMLTIEHQFQIKILHLFYLNKKLK
jgi:pentapeptide MXKDX repeat protein